MSELTQSIQRDVVIEARPATVFGFFTDSALWAKWWGDGSTIDARVGGRVYIRHPNNIEVSGEVLEIAPPDRIVFTYGYESGKPFGPGATRVSILLAPAGTATKLTLTHELPDDGMGAQHMQGWRFQLSLFANAVANNLHANAASLADAWFALWADPDAAARQTTLQSIASEDLVFRDRYSLNTGQPDLLAHIAAAQIHMPGIVMQRVGNARQCQGTMLADWTAGGADGKVLMSGTNVFTLNGDGKISAVTGVVAG
ncbi:MAG: SRPBCC family protein [Gemmatimonas sp.]